MKNIFIISSWYPNQVINNSGGFFADQARMFQSSGCKVTNLAVIIHGWDKFFKFIASRIKSGPLPHDRDLSIFRYETINPFPKLPPQYLRFYHRKLLKLFNTAIAENGRPDLVIINSSLWAGVAIAPVLNKTGIPFIISEHLKEFLLPTGFSPFETALIRKAHQQAGALVAISAAMEESIRQLTPDLPTMPVIIPNPVDIDTFYPGENTIDEKPFKFITTSFLRREKQIDLLLYALAKLINEGSDVLLQIIGDGPERKNLVNLCRELNLSGYVQFTGHQTPEQVRQSLNGNHAFVLSSSVETFGIAVLEAQACGLPVVATRCGGPEDTVTTETGILVDKNSPTALAEGMKQMMSDYGKFDPNAIRTNIINNFGAQSFIEKYNRLIDSLIG